jgi:hypothetical protein
VSLISIKFLLPESSLISIKFLLPESSLITTTSKSLDFLPALTISSSGWT